MPGQVDCLNPHGDIRTHVPPVASGKLAKLPPFGPAVLKAVEYFARRLESAPTSFEEVFRSWIRR